MSVNKPAIEYGYVRVKCGKRFPREPVSLCGTAFLSLASHWPGFPTAGFAHPAGYGGAERCSAKPRLRPRRATFFLASPRKKAKKATRLHRSFAWANDSPALLTTGGRRRTRPAGSDSCAGLPRPLLRGSKVQTGFQEHRAFTDATSQITGQRHEPLITCIFCPL